METLPNVLTSDAYTPTCTIGPIPEAEQTTFTIANAPVFMQVFYGDREVSRERLVLPSEFALAKATGARLRSAIPGTPARVLVTVWTPDEPQPLGSIPFTATLSPSGALSGSDHLTGIVNANGTVAAGTGFTVNRTGIGAYTVTFNTPFSATPVVLADAINLSAGDFFHFLDLVSQSPSAFSAQIYDNAGAAHDNDFNFTVQAVS